MAKLCWIKANIYKKMHCKKTTVVLSKMNVKKQAEEHSGLGLEVNTWGVDGMVCCSSWEWCSVDDRAPYWDSLGKSIRITIRVHSENIRRVRKSPTNMRFDLHFQRQVGSTILIHLSDKIRRQQKQTWRHDSLTHPSWSLAVGESANSGCYVLWMVARLSGQATAPQDML